jgi:hypothetical protein
MSSRGRMPALALVAVVALVFGSMGSAVAGPAAGLTKKQVTKVAQKVVRKAAPGLSVASAKSADTATFAKNADKLDNIDSTGFVGTPTAMKVVIAGQVSAAGVASQKVGDWTSSKAGTGQYDILWPGGALDSANFLCLATGIAAVAVQCSSIGLVARMNTYSAGVFADGAFDFVVYKVG